MGEVEEKLKMKKVWGAYNHNQINEKASKLY